jgi:hypothetical protein
MITENVQRLTDFYEKATGLTADRQTEDFAEFKTSVGTLAIGGARTAQFFGSSSVPPSR